MSSKRPGALTAIAIIGLILGSLGTCSGLTSIGSILAQDSLQAFSRQMVETASMGDPSALQAQLEMQDRVNALAAEWRPALLGHQVLNMLASLALVAGCILLLRGKPKGPAIVIAAAAASILIDGAGGVITALYQLESSAIVEEFLAQQAASDPALAGAERSMSAIGTASARAAMLFSGVWALVKIGFYAFSIVRLRKPDVRALFAH